MDNVFIRPYEDDFHIVFKDHRRAIEIPRDEWLEHVEKRSAYRDSRSKINRYVRRFKDQPMRVERYHVEEGEIIKFD